MTKTNKEWKRQAHPLYPFGFLCSFLQSAVFLSGDFPVVLPTHSLSSIPLLRSRQSFKGIFSLIPYLACLSAGTMLWKVDMGGAHQAAHFALWDRSPPLSNSEKGVQIIPGPRKRKKKVDETVDRGNSGRFPRLPQKIQPIPATALGVAASMIYLLLLIFNCSLSF